MYEGDECHCCGEAYPDDYEAILERSAQAYEMGVWYRQFFEKQVKSHGKINCYASLLPPEQWLIFIGVAALSGVIGNATYDLVKSVIKKIIETAKSEGANEIADKYDSDKKIEILIIQINEYINSPEKIHPEVLRGIKEEERVDNYMYGFTEIMEIKGNRKLSPEEVEEKIKKIKNRKAKMKSINEKNFAHFWDKHKK
ncbi:hypothetical protein QMG90_01985 [Trabulsiella odontotermitis]|uniref:hypothetical protein n=1 Tax=Trabulsiella odontotermitis TaxID=379893 RepID=UPI0024B685EA|nr:hypothetical protein [Trabulsiella odontotermitis]WHP31743.1 hypothetical protein QMG90_01985 [Trabulsiella odontotermitis]